MGRCPWDANTSSVFRDYITLCNDKFIIIIIIIIIVIIIIIIIINP